MCAVLYCTIPVSLKADRLIQSYVRPPHPQAIFIRPSHAWSWEPPPAPLSSPLIGQQNRDFNDSKDDCAVCIVLYRQRSKKS
jgi:hypothetical protein